MAKRTQTTDTDRNATRIIEVPIAAPAAGFVSRHVDLRLTLRQAQTLKAILAGADQGRETLASGRRVVSGNDAIRLLLERIADAK